MLWWASLSRAPLIARSPIFPGSKLIVVKRATVQSTMLYIHRQARTPPRPLRSQSDMSQAPPRDDHYQFPFLLMEMEDSVPMV